VTKHNQTHDHTIASSQFTTEEHYWLDYLAGELELVSFPKDYTAATVGQPTATAAIPISDSLGGRLTKLSNQSGARLYMILMAGLAGLLYKYNGKKDIVLATPTLKQDVEANFVNTVLLIRSLIQPGSTFKELLLATRKSITGGTEHQNYPVQTLLAQLDPDFSGGVSSFFDIGLLLEDIHDSSYLEGVSLNLLFSFKSDGGKVTGEVCYKPSLYNEASIQLFASHLAAFMETALQNVDQPLDDIDILSDSETNALLKDFNDSAFPCSTDHTIHGKIEALPVDDQQTAVVDAHGSITYKELNARAGAIAAALIKRSIAPGMLVAVMMERSKEMMAALLGIMKTGAAYVPININYPESRVRYILEDSAVNLVLTRGCVDMSLPGVECLDIDSLESGETAPLPDVKPDAAAYCIYTSGSTGLPKGALVPHRNVINLTGYHQHLFGETIGTRMSQVASPSFDAMAFEIWPCLCTGGTLYIADSETQMDPAKMKDWLIDNKIEISYQPTVLAEQLLALPWPSEGIALKSIRVAGDKLKRYLQRPMPFTLYNLYGPTEDTVWTTWAEVGVEAEAKTAPHIGSPAGNKQVYILGGQLELRPIGVPGELCIAGAGVAMGYLNRPELTADKFVSNPYKESSPLGPDAASRLYRTGDLARFLPGGEIEFVGRVDHQVKIRGFRVELGEIENQLTALADVDEAVVIDLQRESGEKFLSGYITSKKQLDGAELRQTLGGNIPEYMVPAYLTQLDKIPLTPNGKVDRRALPAPDTGSLGEYVAPRNDMERKLVTVWADVLELAEEEIGIDSNFFEIGGHSLNANLTLTKIHKELEVKIPLTEIFKMPTIRELAQYIQGMARDSFQAIPKAAKAGHYPLSGAQHRLYILQQLIPDSTGYNIPMPVKLEGSLDRQKLENAFKRLIQRHEPLRTSFVTVDNEPRQKIHDTVEFELDYFEAGNGPEGKSVENLIDAFIRPFDLATAPLMRVGLIAQSKLEHVLVMDFHHIVTDYVSNELFVRDLTALYGGEELPNPRLQYRDYACWQQSPERQEAVKRQREFWMREFGGGIPQLNLPLDFERPEVLGHAGSQVRFQICEEPFNSLQRLAKEHNTTLFTVFLAVCYVFLHKLSHQEEIVIGTPVAGRPHSDLEDIFGAFINTLALKGAVDGKLPFAAFLEEIRDHTLKALENQDVQYDELVETLVKDRSADRNPLFDVMMAYAGGVDTTVEAAGLEVSPYTTELSSAKFDLLISCGERPGGLNVSLGYSTNLFKSETVERFSGYFQDIVAAVVADSRVLISGIQLSLDVQGVSKEKKDVQFNF
jgi:amino acid adenylation domain-containing protein